MTVKIFERKIAIIFLSISLNMCFGCSKNCLTETVLLSTHSMFWLKNKKIIFSYTRLSGGLCLLNEVRTLFSCFSLTLYLLLSSVFRQNVRSGLDPNCLTLTCLSFLKELFEKILLIKIRGRHKFHAKLPSMQRFDFMIWIHQLDKKSKGPDQLASL